MKLHRGEADADSGSQRRRAASPLLDESPLAQRFAPPDAGFGFSGANVLRGIARALRAAIPGVGAAKPNVARECQPYVGQTDTWTALVGSFLSAEEVKDRIHAQSVDQVFALVDRGELLCIPAGEEREPRFPAFQFVRADRVDPTVASVVRIFSHVVETPYTTAAWFFGPKPYLENSTPIDWLRGNRDPDRVLAGARVAAARLAQ